jgi:hypothetical protein
MSHCDADGFATGDRPPEGFAVSHIVRMLAAARGLVLRAGKSEAAHQPTAFLALSLLAEARRVSRHIIMRVQ